MNSGEIIQKAVEVLKIEADGITSLAQDRIDVDFTQSSRAGDLGITANITDVAGAGTAMTEIDDAIQNVVRVRAGWDCVLV